MKSAGCLKVGVLDIGEPALVPYDGCRAISVSYDGAGARDAASLAESIALQLLCRAPAGLARITLYQPRPSKDFPLVKRLFSDTEGQAGRQLLHEQEYQDHIHRLVELAHRRLALLAAARCDNLLEYNAAGSEPEVFEYLLVTLCAEHSHRNDQTNQNLRSLCDQGPAAGIVPILAFPLDELDELDSHPRNQVEARWRRLQESSVGFVWEAEHLALRNQSVEIERLFRILSLDPRPSLDEREKLADRVKHRFNSARSDAAERDFLRVPIGTVGTRDAYFTMGPVSNVYHALIGGRTRSGKSNLLKTIMLAACEQYGPDELRLWLIDYQGLSFQPFVGLEHVEEMTAGDKDAALAILAEYAGLAEQRRMLMRGLNPPATRLEDYNARSEEKLHRCILVVDEAHNLFGDPPSARKKNQKHLSKVAKEGAALGLHLILVTQGFQNFEIDSDVKDQFALRVGFESGSAAAMRSLMGRGNEGPSDLPRYAAVYNADCGRAASNVIVHTREVGDFKERLDILMRAHPRRTPLLQQERRSERCESEYPEIAMLMKRSPGVTASPVPRGTTTLFVCRGQLLSETRGPSAPLPSDL